MDIVTEIMKFIDPAMLVVVVVLMLLGRALKATPRVPDWSIVWILPIVGIIFAIGLLGGSVQAVIQGILAAAMAVLTHQLYTQMKDKE